LETLACQIAAITGRADSLSIERPVVFTFAGDHGVAAEGVSAYPQEVTAQMVRNFLRGGAGINVLARQAGADVVVADLGVARELANAPGLVQANIGRATANIALGPAMTRAQAVASILKGAEIAFAAKEKGAGLFAIGEMGIANTTAASALASAFLGLDAEVVTGNGTGLDEAGRRRKVDVIRRALAINRPEASDPIDVLAKLGGFEIAGLAGVVLAGAASRTPVVVDGFISAAAALTACRIAPAAGAYLIASHMSVERGHRALLKALDLEALFDFGLRLGEGTGAALAIPVLRSACAVYNEMATFDSAGVAEKVL
jgi:nicotinate-nucleotide--dimethylbenzimidazole phosphoribosyltransferase